MEFNYIPPDEVAQNHRARNAEVPLRQRDPRQRNVEAVLSLGDVRYITYRNRTYRIPPVPFKLGQSVLDSHTKVLAHAKQVVQTGKKEPMDAFYRQMSIHVGLLWQHIRPIGKMKRALWHMGLMRNPFRSASEAEVKAITDFFLQGRMTSSVRLTSEAGK
jgi:hypothetical protein